MQPEATTDQHKSYSCLYKNIKRYISDQLQDDYVLCRPYHSPNVVSDKNIWNCERGYTSVAEIAAKMRAEVDNDSTKWLICQTKRYVPSFYIKRLVLNEKKPIIHML